MMVQRVAALATTGVLAILGSTAPLHSPPAVAADVAQGRITLTAPSRVLDTTLAAGAEIPLPPGLLHVALSGGGSEATAFVLACGQPPSGTPTFHFAAGEVLSRPVYVENGTTCLQAGTDVQVRADRYGTIAAAPFAGGLQFTEVYPGIQSYWAEHGPNTDGEVSFARGELLPEDTVAATYRITAYRRTDVPAAVTLRGCQHPPPPGPQLIVATRQADDPDLTLDAFTIATVALDPGELVCASITGDAGIEVLPVGALIPQGEAPAALPPTVHSEQRPVPVWSVQPMAPSRAYDTRLDISLKANELRSVGGLADATVAATVVNLTATNASTAGYLAVWACNTFGASGPPTSSLNFQPGRDVANQAHVRWSKVADDSRQLCLRSSADTDVIIDRFAHLASGLGRLASPLPAVRIVDTRNDDAPGGRLAPGAVRRVDVRAHPAIPDGVDAVTATLTVTAPDGAGYLTAWPCDQARPTTSVLNFRGGEDVANQLTVGLSDVGELCLWSSVATDVLVDIGMWIGAGAQNGYIPGSDRRVVDTRSPAAAPAGRVDGSRLRVQFGDDHGVSSTAVAVTLNVTATGAERAGFLTAYPCDQPQPNASNVNYAPLRDAANQVTVALAADRSVCIAADGPTHVLVDLVGSWEPNSQLIWRSITTPDARRDLD